MNKKVYFNKEVIKDRLLIYTEIADKVAEIPDYSPELAKFKLKQKETLAEQFAESMVELVEKYTSNGDLEGGTPHTNYVQKQIRDINTANHPKPKGSEAPVGPKIDMNASQDDYPNSIEIDPSRLDDFHAIANAGAKEKVVVKDELSEDELNKLKLQRAGQTKSSKEKSPDVPNMDLEPRATAEEIKAKMDEAKAKKKTSKKKTSKKKASKKKATRKKATGK